MVYKGATDYIETNLCTKRPKKKKKAPKHPETKGRGERQERKIQKSRKKLKDKRLASYIHKIRGEKEKER